MDVSRTLLVFPYKQMDFYFFCGTGTLLSIFRTIEFKFVISVGISFKKKFSLPPKMINMLSLTQVSEIYLLNCLSFSPFLKEFCHV